MALEVGSVFTRLGFRADDSQATRYERRADAVRARAAKPIEQKVSFNFDGRELTRYEQRVSTVRAKAAKPIEQKIKVTADTAEMDRLAVRLAALGTKGAIEQELGAKLDDREFRRFERELDKAEQRTKRRDAFKAQLGARFDPTAYNEYEKRTQAAESATGGLIGMLQRAGVAAGGAGDGMLKLKTDIGPLSGPLRAMGGVLAVILPLLLAVGGAAVALGSSLAAAAAGAAAVGVGIAAAAGPLAAIAGAIVHRVGLISDAYTALDNQQAKGASTARANASAQQSAARAIASAQQSLDDARRTGAERVAAAEQALQDAQRSRGRTVADAERQLQDARTQSARQIAEAEQRLADARAAGATQIRTAEQALAEARISGQEAVKAAEGSLASALADARVARDALTDAEGRATREREDLARSARQAQLDEESASIALARAQERLRALTGQPHSALDVREAQNAVRIAQEGVLDAAEARRRADQDAAAGTNTVKAARDQLAEANRRVAQSERDVHTAQADAALSRQRAENELRQATTDAARERRDAEAAVAAATTAAAAAIAAARRNLARDTADSDRAVSRAHADVGAAASDAARQTARAVAAVAAARTAAADAISNQGAAADAVDAKLAKLTATERRLLTSARSFAAAFRDTFAPATDAIFAGVDRALGRIEPLMVRYKARLGAIGDEIGALIDRGAASLAGPEWTRALDSFVATAQRVVQPLGEAMGSALDALRDIAVAAQPYVIEFAEYLRDAFARLADATGDSQHLDGVIGDLVHSTKDWWNLLVAVADLLITIFGGGKAEGDNLVETLTKIVRRWDAFLETREGQKRMRAFFRDAVTTTKDLASVLADLVSIIFKVSTWFLKMGDSWNSTEIEIQRGSLAVAQTLRDAFVWAIDQVIGAFTSLLGIFSTIASALGHLPGGGKFKAIAGEIDAARDAMDGLRKTMRDGNAELGRQQNLQLMRQEVTVLTEKLSHLDKGSDDYRQTAEKLRGKQRQLNSALAAAEAAGDKGAKGPRALAASSGNALAVIDDANAAIVSSYNQLAHQLGDLKPLKFRASKALGALLDRPNGLSDTPPVPLGRASGGWIGQPGQAGPDTIHGRAPVGAAVLNRHQLPYVGAALAAHGLDIAALTGGAHSGATAPVSVGAGEFLVAPDRVGLLDGILGAVGMGGLDELFSRVRTPHWMAGGGRVTGDTDYGPQLARALEALSATSGRPIFVQSGGRTMAEQAALVAQKGLYSASNPTGAAAPSPDAPHIRGIAADITPGREVFAGLAGRFGLGFPLSAEPWHIQLLNAAGITGGARGALAALAQITAPKITGPAGALRSMAQRIAARVATAANTHLGGTTGAGGGGSSSANQALGRRMMARLFALNQWPALRELWTRESGWNANARNPSSGAYGIPQALPASKMPKAAQRGDAASQIGWGLRYIKGRYGTPAAALAFHNAHNWYTAGGHVTQTLASGGYISSGAYRGLRKLQGTRIAAYDRAQDRVEQLQNDYSYRDREFNLTDEELIDPDTGAVNVDAVNKRAGELAKLIEIREAIVAKLNAMRQIVARIQTTYRHLISRLQAALKSISRKTQGGRARRAQYTAAISRYRGELDEWGDKSGELFEAWRDAGLDVREVKNERADVLGTQSTATPDTDTSPDQGGDVAPSEPLEPVTRPPTAEEIAAAAAAQFAAFQSARQELFSSFGSNNARVGTDPFAGPTGLAAGTQHFGAIAQDARAYAAAGGRVTYMENPVFNAHYPETPPTGDTYIQAAAREAAAAYA